MTTNPIKYVEVRIEQLKEEYSKNPSEKNAMISTTLKAKICYSAASQIPAVSTLKLVKLS